MGQSANSGPNENAESSKAVVNSPDVSSKERPLNTTRTLVRRKFQDENLEGVTLIWLDESMVETKDECKKILSSLRKLNDFVLFYNDSKSCVDYIKTVEKESILLIMSGVLSKSVFPQIQFLRQLDSMFLCCSRRSDYEYLKQQYRAKVVDIFTDMESIYKAIHEQLRLLSKHTITFSFFNQKQKAARDLTHETASFLWFQCLFNVLKELPQTESAKNEMLTKCSEYYLGNEKELKTIENFKRTYKSNDAIAWYTDECFVYRLLNKALRTEDIDGLHLFRFYVIDLCRQLEEESRKNVGIMTLYRGQIMSEDEFNRLKSGIGHLISTNGFFSTTLLKEVALSFLTLAKTKRPDVVPILFEIKADSTMKSIIFANIEHYSHLKNEQEVLFSLGAVFKILNVEYSNELDCWIIQMTVTDEGMKEVQEYIHITRTLYADTSISILFGWLLIKMNQLKKAEKYFELLLASSPPGSLEEADVLNEMGQIYLRRSQHIVALDYTNRAYEIRKNFVDANHPKISNSLRNLGSLYRRTGDCDKAIEYYKCSLDIERKTCGEIGTIGIAGILQNLGQTYRKKGDWETALNYFTQTLKMRQHFLPKEHSDIASSFWDIGSVYYLQKHYEEALVYFFDALKIFQKQLPIGHAKTSRLFVAIVNAYIGKEDYETAIHFCQVKLKELCDELDESHPAVARIFCQIGNILQKRGNNQDALSHYEKALPLFEKCDPPELEEISNCLKFIGNIQKQVGNYNLALNYYLRELDLGQKLYLHNDLRIGHALCSIGEVYFNLKKFDEALKNLEDALCIFQSKHLNNHDDIQRTLNIIKEVRSSKSLNTSQH